MLGGESANSASAMGDDAASPYVIDLTHGKWLTLHHDYRPKRKNDSSAAASLLPETARFPWRAVSFNQPLFPATDIRTR